MVKNPPVVIRRRILDRSRQHLSSPPKQIVTRLACLPLGSPHAVHVQRPGFVLTSDTAGQVTLTLINGQTLDPNVVNQEMAQAGIPARVDVGEACRNDVTGSVARQWIQSQIRTGIRHVGDDTTLVTFSQSTMPKGMELDITIYPAGQYAGTELFGLDATNQPLTCTRNPSPPGPRKFVPASSTPDQKATA